MINERPETDALDLEDVLIQVMNDEFDVVVDDDSAAPVAAQIMAIREQTARGEFGFVQELWEAWQRKAQQKGNNVAAAFKQVKALDDEDTDEEDEVEEDEDEDVDMDEAPALVRAPRERVEPEVDEDGFTKVVGKKRR